MFQNTETCRIDLRTWVKKKKKKTYDKERKQLKTTAQIFLNLPKSALACYKWQICVLTFVMLKVISVSKLACVTGKLNLYAGDGEI